MKPTKKILIITYYWPPAGGPGVQRWLKFAKYLPENGWQPTVFIPENPSYPIIDDSLTNEVPKDITLIKQKIWEPYRLAEKLNKNNKKFKAGQFDVGKNQSWKSKLSIWIRGNFFIPDARIFWVKPSVKTLLKHLETHHYDAIVTTGPPHSVHLIGWGLKQKNPQLKWIADFRDPWTQISYYKHLKLSRKSDRLHKDLEALVFKNADITLATSYTDAENFKQMGAKAFCITNGFDVETELSTVAMPQQFTLAYIGVLEQLRNPEVLWSALNLLIEKNPEFYSDFTLKFVGRLDEKISESILNTKLGSCFQDLGYLSHQESIAEMQKSTMLLITNFPNLESKGIIPGKLFEYLSTGNILLSFGPSEADVEKIIQQTQAGKHFTYDVSDTEIMEFIEKQYFDWKHNSTQKISNNIHQFSRKSLTKQLVNLLNSH
ncbi:MAG: glycosyl transferase family 1 [Bacteroidetes bacterium]|nr:glycosyl transferase family 1 [Bacteroidota bacterium]